MRLRACVARSQQQVRASGEACGVSPGLACKPLAEFWGLKFIATGDMAWRAALDKWRDRLQSLVGARSPPLVAMISWDLHCASVLQYWAQLLEPPTLRRADRHVVGQTDNLSGLIKTLPAGVRARAKRQARMIREVTAEDPGTAHLT